MNLAPKPHPDEWRHGRWAAWVFDGADREDRRARLAEVPEAKREYVKNCVERAFVAKAAKARVNAIRDGS